MTTLSKRVAVVTGAASGIGRNLAFQLAEAGAHLALVDVDDAGLKVTADEAAKRGGSDLRVSTHLVDVSDRGAMAALPEAVVAEHGAVHVLVNNAGIAVEAGFHEHSLEDWDRVLGVNLWGVIYGCHFFLPHLAQADEAHIVNISSIFGVVGVPGNAAYCASKFGVRGLSEVLWEELRDSHVHVTVVHPGGVNTNIVASSKHTDPESHARVVAFFNKKTMPASKAAAQIVRAIRTNQPRLVITRDAEWADRIKRALPVRGNRIFANMMLKAMGLEGVLKKRQAAALGRKPS